MMMNMPTNLASKVAYPLILRDAELHEQRRAQAGVEPYDVTNTDTMDIDDAADELIDGYPYFYSCERLVDTIVSTTHVLFDYEYTTNELEETLDSYGLPLTASAAQWGLLWTVSRDAGLIHGCNFDLQPFNRTLLEGDTVQVVGLSSTPADSRDASVGACQFLTAKPCYPMQGIMTVYYTGNETSMVNDYILKLIKHNLDGQQTLTGGLTKTLFLGERATYNPGTQPSRSPASSSTNAALAAGLSVGAVVVLMVAFLVYSRRRRVQNVIIEEKPDDMLDLEKATTRSSRLLTDEEDDVVPPGMFVVAHGAPASPEHTVATNVTVKSLGSSTTVLMSNKTKKIDTDELLPDAVSVGSLDSDASDAAIRPDTPPPQDPTNFSGEPVNQDRPTQKMVDELPPLPPTGPSTKPPPGSLAAASKIMKRRRKKKKKSKQKIVRVNSRDNVKEMETISEEHDAPDEDEEGSDYSWTDGDSDGSRSRDPSPSRSSESTPDNLSSPSRSW